MGVNYRGGSYFSGYAEVVDLKDIRVMGAPTVKRVPRSERAAQFHLKPIQA